MQALLKQIETFIENEFNKKLPKNRTFHSFNHTKGVVKAVHSICQNVEIDHANKLCLEIAAWFHDYGHISTYSGHEGVSAEMANEFLIKQEFPSNLIKLVKQYIHSTNINYTPSCIEEQIIRDADLIHTGQTAYQRQLDKLQQEWESVFQNKISQKEWLEQNILFLESHCFYTDYVKETYNNQREKNIDYLKETLKTL